MRKRKAIKKTQFAFKNEDLIEKLIKEMERPYEEEMLWWESKSRI